MDAVIRNTYISEIINDLGELPQSNVDKFYQIHPNFPDEITKSNKGDLVDWADALYLVRRSVKLRREERIAKRLSK